MQFFDGCVSLSRGHGLIKRECRSHPTLVTKRILEEFDAVELQERPTLLNVIVGIRRGTREVEHREGKKIPPERLLWQNVSFPLVSRQKSLTDIR